MSKSKVQKRSVIRIEETQDYVRETVAISQEEADEIGSVPSASSLIREGADEFTLRGTQRTFINTEHIEFERW